MLINFKHWPVDHPNFQRGFYNTWDIVTRADGNHFMGTLRRPRPANFAVATCACNTYPCSCGSMHFPTTISPRPKNSLDYLGKTSLSPSKASELVASLKLLGDCNADGGSSRTSLDSPTIDKMIGMGNTIYVIMSDKTVMEVPRSKLQLDNG